MSRIALLGAYVASLGVFVMLLPPPATAGFLQEGYDAARTGVTPESGPGRGEPDLAMRLQFGGGASHVTPPLMVGGDAYIAVRRDPENPNLTEDGVIRINLTTGASQLVVRLYPRPAQHDTGANGALYPYALGSDGSRLFLAHPYGVVGYDLPTMAELWNWSPEPGGYQVYCVSPAVEDGMVYFLCEWHSTLALLDQHDAMHRILILGFNVATGIEGGWQRVLDPVSRLLPSDDYVNTANQRQLRARSVSVAGSTLIGLYEDKPLTIDTLNRTLFAMDLGDPAHPFLWWKHYTVVETGRFLQAQAQEWIGSGYGRQDTVAKYDFVPPTSDGETLYIRAFNLTEFPVVDGRPALTLRDQHDLGKGHIDRGAGPALTDNYYFFASSEKLYRVDRSTRQTVTIYDDLSERRSWGAGGFVVAENILYTRVDEWKYTSEEWEQANFPNNPLINELIYAFDAETGQYLWDFPIPFNTFLRYDKATRPCQFSISDGMMPIGCRDGQFLVLGTAPGSMQALVNLSSMFPAPGALIRADLRHSQPGIGGAPISYRVDWGDGDVTEWQSSPVFDHAFQNGGEHRARFSVQNDANNTASTYIMFHVGATDPSTQVVGTPLVAAPNIVREPLPTWMIVTLVAAGAILGAGVVVILLRARRVHSLPRYTIERELGRGSYAQAFLAHDRILDRPVVLKQSTAPWLLRNEARARFLREGRALAKVRHPNVVGIFEVLADEKLPTLVLEYVDGGSLDKVLSKASKLPVDRVLQIGEQALAGLSEMHSHGIVHRDIKPANLLLERSGRVKLGDFGIARPQSASVDSTLTTNGSQPGSPLYMSPEQAAGKPLGPQSDLYSLGAVLYRMLTGKHHLEGDMLSAYRVQNRTGAGAAPNLKPLPDHWRGFFERAIAVNPKARFTNAEAMRRALGRLDA